MIRILPSDTPREIAEKCVEVESVEITAGDNAEQLVICGVAIPIAWSLDPRGEAICFAWKPVPTDERAGEGEG